MKRQSFRRTGTAALCAAALAAGPVQAEPVTLTIVHVNDLDRLDGSGDRGGVARLAAVIKEVRASADHVLVTNGGDAISPSLLSSFDKGAHMIDLFNQVGFDAMVLGNHEFDFTTEVTTARIAEAEFPILSSNAVEPDGTLIDGVAENLLLDVNRYKVGMFGLTTTATSVVSSPEPVTFRPVTEVAAKQARKLREAGADFVVALAHTGHAEDAELMRQEAVDLLLSGDDHQMKIEIGSELPFGDKTILLEVTGADLLAALENGVGKVEEGAGRFPHVSGMAYRFDASKPPGSRIAEVTVDGTPLDRSRTYRLATNDYLGRGGDGYDVFVDAPRLIDATAGKVTAALVIDAIAAAGEIAPQVDGRIVRLD